MVYNNVNSSSNGVYVVQEEGYGGSNLLGVFRHRKKQSLLRRNSKKYIQISILLLLTSGILGLQKQE
jgi:hypothetical protein